MTTISSTAEIIADLRAGRMVILVDEEERENEGDMLMAAEFVTPDAINFMAKHGRGLICLTLTEERCRQLDLQQQIKQIRSGSDHAKPLTFNDLEPGKRQYKCLALCFQHGNACFKRAMFPAVVNRFS